MDVSILARIIGIDAAQKGTITGNKALSPAVIQNGFSITSQINHSMAILPANSNVYSDDARKLAVAKDFRSNEQEMITGRVVDLAHLHVIPTAQKIKTNIFVSAAAKILTWSPLDRFTAAAQIKSGTRPHQVEPEITVLEEPSYTGNVVQLFPVRGLKHA